VKQCTRNTGSHWSDFRIERCPSSTISAGPPPLLLLATKNKPQDQELRRFRTEAEEMLGVKVKK
jgi:hypothetical protein